MLYVTQELLRSMQAYIDSFRNKFRIAEKEIVDDLFGLKDRQITSCCFKAQSARRVSVSVEHDDAARSFDLFGFHLHEPLNPFVEIERKRDREIVLCLFEAIL